MTDSPWFWFFLFVGMALLAAFAIGPKHERRQERIVRMQDAREAAAQGYRPSTDDAGRREPATMPDWDATLLERLVRFLFAAWPLKVFLIVVLAAGAMTKSALDARQRAANGPSDLAESGSDRRRL